MAFEELKYNLKEWLYYFDKKKFFKRLAIVILIICLLEFNLTISLFVNGTRFLTGSASKYKKHLDYLVSCVEDYQEVIQLNDVSQLTVSRLLHEVREGIPRLFYIDTLSYKYTSNDKKNFQINVTYSYKKADLEKLNADLDKRIDYICSFLKPEWNNKEKAVYFNNYLCSWFEYDYSYSIYDAYTMLVEGTGVCSAYSALYKLLCDKVGIDCTVVWTNVDNHCWNQVKLNGFWYNVDVTWNDSDSEPNKYLLLPDVMVWGDGHHSWQSCGAYKTASFRFNYIFERKKLAKAENIKIETNKTI